MNDEVQIEVGEVLYTITVDHFSPPGPYRWNEPPETGELDLSDEVQEEYEEDPFHHISRVNTVSLGDMCKAYAEYHLISVDAAREKIISICFERMLERMEDDYPDDY